MFPITRSRVVSTPFDALTELRREMDRMFDDTAGSRLEGWRMPTEVSDTGEGLRFDIELPGVRLEDIDLTIEDNVLTVSGEKKMERDESSNEGDYRLFERRYGRFERSFVLPRNVDREKVDARLDNGVLTVVLPKVEAARPRKIQISGENRQVGSGEAK